MSLVFAPGLVLPARYVLTLAIDGCTPGGEGVIVKLSVLDIRAIKFGDDQD